METEQFYLSPIQKKSNVILTEKPEQKLQGEKEVSHFKVKLANHVFSWKCFDNRQFLVRNVI